MRYYALAARWISEHAPASTLMDVGNGGADVIAAGVFSRRIALDREPLAPRHGIEAIEADWLTWTPTVRPDVITCLQMLEHLPDGEVEASARKLLENADVVIVSVPHNWPKGQCAEHFQDPVSLEKLCRWMGRAPDRYEIVSDNGRERLVAEFRAPGVSAPEVPQWPPVTVIVPHYAQRTQLGACIEALLRQDYPGPFTIVVVDNSETDQCDALKREFPGVTFLWQPQPGSYAARNAAIAQAGQGVLAFTDADCIPYPDWLRHGVLHLCGPSSPACVGGYIEVVLPQGRRPTIAERLDLIASLRQRHKISRGYALTANLFTWKNVIDEIGPFDARLYSGGDYEWGRRLRGTGAVIAYERLAAVRHGVRGHRALNQKAWRLAGGSYMLTPTWRGLRIYIEFTLRGIPGIWWRIAIASRREIPRWQKPLVALYCLYRGAYIIAARLIYQLASLPPER